MTRILALTDRLFKSPVESRQQLSLSAASPWRKHTAHGKGHINSTMPPFVAPWIVRPPKCRYTTLSSSLIRVGAKLSSTIAALAALGACGSTSAILGQDWTRIEIEPTALRPPYVVIDFGQTGLRFNDVPVSEAQVLVEIKKVVSLEPRHFVFLRFSWNDKEGAYSLARKIRHTGACNEGHCVFRIVGPIA